MKLRVGVYVHVRVFFIWWRIKAEKKKGKQQNCVFPWRQELYMVNEANLMKLILRKRMPLACDPCNVYSAFSRNRVGFGVLWGFLFLKVKCLVPVPNLSPNPT